MKSIQIREKIIPFSHRPGADCIVPLSNWVVSIYPAMLRIGTSLSIPIRVTGPVDQFLVQVDLQRDCVWFSGKAKEGFYRCKLSAIEEGLVLTVDRAPNEGLGVGSHQLQRKQKILLASGGTVIEKRPVEQISLGNWKAQDWDLVCRRNDPREIIPALYLLGQKVPASEAKGAMAALLASRGQLQSFCQAAFSGILVPHLHDVFHRGIGSNEIGSGDPIGLLPRAAQIIRSSLIEEKTQRHLHQLRILPDLPSEWVAGRAVGLRTGIGTIDLEWTKRSIRRMILHVEESCDVAFIFSHEIKSFGCNGKRVSNGEPLSLKSGKILIDRFVKK